MEAIHSPNRMTDATDPDAAERAMILRLCWRFTSDSEAAEDLTQEVLLVAWLNRHKVADQQARARWLAGIARNVCLHWCRDRGRALKRIHRPDVDETEETAYPSDAFDLELDYEKREVRDLLARALARLPAETGEALVQHYAQGVPRAEIAADLGVTNEAVEIRLRRGRSTLRKLLATEFGEEAASIGIVPPSAIGWSESRIWCAECGRGHLMIRFAPNATIFYCSHCHPEANRVHTELPLTNPHFFELVGGLRQPRRILDKTLQWSNDYFVQPHKSADRACTNCGHRVVLRRYGPDPAALIEGMNLRTGQGLYVHCDRCGNGSNVSLGAILDALPQVRAFNGKHQRTRARGVYAVEGDGRPAFVGGYQTLDRGSAIDVVVDAASFVPITIRTSADE